MANNDDHTDHFEEENGEVLHVVRQLYPAEGPCPTTVGVEEGSLPLPREDGQPSMKSYSGDGDEKETTKSVIPGSPLGDNRSAPKEASSCPNNAMERGEAAAPVSSSHQLLAVGIVSHSISTPGAYPVTPIRGENLPSDDTLDFESINENISQETHPSRETTNSNTQGLVAAMPVEETRYQQAEPMQPDVTDDENGKSLNKVWLSLLTVAFCVVIVTTTIFAVRRDTGGVTDAPAIPVTETHYPTFSPTSLLESRVLDLLPNHTRKAFINSTSAQSKAFDWMMEDPHLESYFDTEWRIHQRFALATFYYSTGGDYWGNNNHWLSHDMNECDWFARPAFEDIHYDFFERPTYDPSYPCGDNTTSLFHHLWLFHNNLTGSIPEELYLLSNLKSINIATNALTGSVSTRIGHLENLEGLALENNALTGTLPTQVGQLSSNLYYFSVYFNHLTGKIPTEFGKLTLTDKLMLDRNLLTGTIPSELSQLSRARVFYWNLNLLSGSLPSEVGLLERLLDWHADENFLTGTVR